MSEVSLWEHQRAVHLRYVEVVERVINNRDLMRQVEESFAAHARGERSTAYREILASMGRDTTSDDAARSARSDGVSPEDNLARKHDRAMHRHLEETTARVLANKPLMEQAHAGLERLERGERGVPLREILEERRRQRSER